MNQISIFDAPRHPRARNADPLSSHAAAARLEKFGVVKAQMQQVLEAVNRWPNCTSKELAQVSGLDRAMIGRRLSELEEEGKILDSGRHPNGTRKTSDTPCAVAGIKCVRWRPV